MSQHWLTEPLVHLMISRSGQLFEDPLLKHTPEVCLSIQTSGRMWWYSRCEDVHSPHVILSVHRLLIQHQHRDFALVERCQHASGYYGLQEQKSGAL